MRYLCMLLLSACSVGGADPGELAVPLGGAQLVGTYDVASVIKIDQKCNGVLPYLSTLRMQADGRVDIEDVSAGKAVARWVAESQGFVLEQASIAGWAARDTSFERNASGALEAQVEWRNAATNGECRIQTTLRRL